jgi:hypothetical protein
MDLPVLRNARAGPVVDINHIPLDHNHLAGMIG